MNSQIGEETTSTTERELKSKRKIRSIDESELTYVKRKNTEIGETELAAGKKLCETQRNKVNHRLYRLGFTTELVCPSSYFSTFN